jgi:DNA primase
VVRDHLGRRRSRPPVDRIRILLGGHDGTLLIPDNDDAGRRCAEKLIHGQAVHRQLLGEPAEDARDLLARVGPDAFRTLVTERLTALPTASADEIGRSA